MAKTIKEIANKILEDNKDEIVCVYDRYAGIVDGANAVLEAVREELMRAYMNDFEGFSDHDRDIAQGVLGGIQMFLNQLKG